MGGCCGPRCCCHRRVVHPTLADPGDMRGDNRTFMESEMRTLEETEQTVAGGRDYGLTSVMAVYVRVQRRTRKMVSMRRSGGRCDATMAAPQRRRRESRAWAIILWRHIEAAGVRTSAPRKFSRRCSSTWPWTECLFAGGAGQNARGLRERRKSEGA